MGRKDFWDAPYDPNVLFSIAPPFAMRLHLTKMFGLDISFSYYKSSFFSLHSQKGYPLNSLAGEKKLANS
jgi:hypothetical protein